MEGYNFPPLPEIEMAAFHVVEVNLGCSGTVQLYVILQKYTLLFVFVSKLKTLAWKVREGNLDHLLIDHFVL